MTAANILVVDDEPDIRSLVQEILADEGYEVETADNGAGARRALRDRRPELILLDIWMPDVDGITLLKEWSEDGQPPCPVIMMSGHGTVETAVEATRLGAYDFLEKPLSLAKLLLTVERALEADRLVRENVGLKPRGHAVEPIGRSPVMQRLREQVKRIARHDTWVLLNGEPGSGKETFARYLHANSARRERPFVDVGTTALTRANAAAELFGTEEDERLHYGRLEQANGGVLYLSEVGDMDLDAQAHLLGALESGSFLRMGGTEPVEIDVRVIAASQRNLEEEVREGRFREDLFYHLNVVPLHIPPLREHREDIPELLEYYVDYCVSQEKLPYRRFGVGAQNHLRNHPWRGNVRELKNLVQRLLILGAGEDVSVEEVDTALGAVPVPPGQAAAVTGVALDLNLPLREAREQFEKAYLEYQLDKVGGNVSKLAAAVGMERTHVYRKLRSLGVDAKGR